ncbi:MAG TPA: heme lyase CcmF/NrfE family subunit [Candidatus Saccharimonadales bacterium]|nr:heme lyase CcmF/NrfE family subunit [Candidatus Saccharimonadales bacterium]
MPDIGNLSLLLALVCAVWAILTSWLGTRSSSRELVRSGERAALAATVLLTIGVSTLIRAMVLDDFSLLYVAENSTRSQPLPYKVAALWGGQAGSLLLWAWILSLYSFVVILQNRKRNRDLMPGITGTLMGILSFFLLVICFTANPFEAAPGPIADGGGLNPLLQNPLMVIHPPMLYTGYVGVSVPFAFGLAALMTGKLGNDWIVSVRRWSLFAWFFLGIGILLGGYWAYVELGWGGYWAWDPVENASLMPWLAMSAFIHSIMIQEKKGMLKVWNMILVLLAFCLSILGTFLTRSGVVSSVHSFARSSIGPWFAGFLIIAITVSLSLLFWRLPRLKAENRLDSFISRESAFLFNNVVFVAICFTVLWGTVYPIITEAFQGEKVSVGPPWFNQWIVPLGLALLFLTGVGPLVSWRRASPGALKRMFLRPGLTGLLTMLVLFTFGMRHIAAILTFGLCTFVLATIVSEFYRGARARTVVARESLPRGAVHLVSRNKRRYGGYIVHAGVVLVFLGVAGSAGFQQEASKTLRRGETMQAGAYTLRFVDTSSSSDAHKDVLTTVLAVERNGRELTRLRPEKFFFRASQQPTTEAAIYGMWHWPPHLIDDVYAILVDFNPQSGGYTFKVYVNPLVSFIWIGGLIIVLGTHIAVLPEWAPRKVSVRSSAQREARHAAT